MSDYFYSLGILFIDHVKITDMPWGKVVDLFEALEGEENQ